MWHGTDGGVGGWKGNAGTVESTRSTEIRTGAKGFTEPSTGLRVLILSAVFLLGRLRVSREEGRAIQSLSEGNRGAFISHGCLLFSLARGSISVPQCAKLTFDVFLRYCVSLSLCGNEKIRVALLFSGKRAPDTLGCLCLFAKELIATTSAATDRAVAQSMLAFKKLKVERQGRRNVDCQLQTV